MALDEQDCLDVSMRLSKMLADDFGKHGFNQVPFVRLTARIQIALQEAAAGNGAQDIWKRLGT